MSGVGKINEKMLEFGQIDSKTGGGAQVYNRQGKLTFFTAVVIESLVA